MFSEEVLPHVARCLINFPSAEPPPPSHSTHSSHPPWRTGAARGTASRRVPPQAARVGAEAARGQRTPEADRRWRPAGCPPEVRRRRATPWEARVQRADPTSRGAATGGRQSAVQTQNRRASSAPDMVTDHILVRSLPNKSASFTKPHIYKNGHPVFRLTYMYVHFFRF